MAQIDTSIYGQIKPLQIESPMNALMQVSQVQNAQRQNKLAEFTLAAQERETSADNALAGLITSGKGSADIAKELAGHGYGKQSIAYTKQAAEMAKQQREAEKAQLESAIQKQTIVAQYAGAAKDQASWQQGLQALSAMGVDVSKVPQQFSPQTAELFRTSALTGAQQLEQVWKQKQFDLDTDKFGYQKQNDTANRNVTLRGQNMTDARGREANALKKQEIAAGGKSPAGYRWKPDGSLEAIPGGPAEKDNLGTEGEKNASGYGLRMQEAEKIMAGVVDKDPSAQKPGAVETVIGGNNAVSNFSRSSTRQQYRQGQEDWVRAKLRKESGAVIGADEMDQEIKTYFPQPGDKPAVIQQKEQARRVAMEAMKTSAGKAGKGLSTDAAPPSSGPKAGAVMDGYRFKGGNPADKANWEKV